ncbi:MAG: RNA polymerase sigma factor [Acidobacteria bacterium]|nr:RNA polymerase sigma factor [Acidobacteriota bacterium]
MTRFIGIWWRHLALSLDAEDITQECFIQLYRTLGGGRAIENTRAWLYRTAHNQALSQIKHQRFLAPINDVTWETLLEALPDLSLNPEEDLLENEANDERSTKRCENFRHRKMMFAPSFQRVSIPRDCGNYECSGTNG